ncbi:hypothetical protein F5Y15DRAFT_330159 [Xylariaceae sp. FL0016]|nr:hypothetical protein F5Y15DRAFT_330159 [Xylariaceae sp. FL0016]
MSDQHLATTPTGPHGTLRARTPRTTRRTASQSPSRPRHVGDDLLSRLSPTSAVEALRSPAGALKNCMDQASTSEQNFALRTAIASRKIHEWVEELSNWPWPASGGSAGFEMPPTKRRKLSDSETAQDRPKGKQPENATNHHSTTSYCGSISTNDVVRYERRVEQIYKDMEELDLEEIKSQVLHNHIMPLSRPGTPFSDGGRNIGSTCLFAKMEDMTAVITAITVQALPKLSKLSRLLSAWSVRLLVLQKVPPLLAMISDAEIALQSGWSAIRSIGDSLSNMNNGKGISKDTSSVLSRHDYDVMKVVLQQKVSKPGRDLDYMLDSLEGMVDTLPEAWLDRMEAVERNYAEWATTAERQVREGEWHSSQKSVQVETPTRKPVKELETPRPEIQIHEPSPIKESFDGQERDDSRSTSPALDHSSEVPEAQTGSGKPDKSPRKGAIQILVDEPRDNIPGSTSQVVDLSELAEHQQDVDSGIVAKDPSLEYEPRDSKKSAKSTSKAPGLSSSKQGRNQTFDGSDNVEIPSDEQNSPVLGEVDHNIVRAPPSESSKTPETPLQLSFEEDFERSVLESVHEEDEEEPELPPSHFVNRKQSQISLASTANPYEFDNPPGFSSNLPSREASMEPELPRLPDPNEPFSSDGPSPPSSPPLRYKPRTTSVTFKDIPDVAPLPQAGNTPPRSPLMPPAVFDPDTSYEWESQLNSPSRMSVISSVSEDDHLQKQIRNVLENIPAKIQLKKVASHLNPPDFVPPTQPKAKKSDMSRRSASSLSSRATPSFSRSGTPLSRSGTPSFMLAPARENRPRSKSSQGIRIYHLSHTQGEPPMKLFIRCVGENNERVMVRVGGGWADLGEYLRDYATHHSRRSKGEGKVEVIDVPSGGSRVGSSPPSRPGSAMSSPMTPLPVRKTRRSTGGDSSARVPRTPLVRPGGNETPSPDASFRSRASSNTNWDEEDSALGLAGPSAGKKEQLNEESRAWVDNVKEKVRVASGERIAAAEQHSLQRGDGRFGELTKIGGTTRLFRKN